MQYRAVDEKSTVVNRCFQNKNLPCIDPYMIVQAEKTQCAQVHCTTKEQAAHSSKVAKRVLDLIHDAGGWIGFDQYMHEVLHAPDHGYYSAGTPKLGANGDYITAPLLGSVFANCLAKQYIEIRTSLKRPDASIILEFGAGTGQMAVDILTRLKGEARLPKRYVIIETSRDLACRQRELFVKSSPELLPIVEWAETIPERICGMVLANEVLDAMPVKRFRVDRSAGIAELGVGAEQDSLIWKEGPSINPRHAARLQELDLPDGYQSELGLQAEYWTASLSETLEEGVAILIDYGFPRREYFHPERADGTLMCHYRHTANMNPFLRPGLQDITTHIDFTAIAQAGQRAGAEIAGFCSQGCFLIGNGILDAAASATSDQHALEIAQQIKKLTLPHEMGELFKVLALSKNYPHRLSGFAFKDIQDKL